jgi:hypothetical protein
MAETCFMARTFCIHVFVVLLYGNIAGMVGNNIYISFGMVIIIVQVLMWFIIYDFLVELAHNIGLAWIVMFGCIEKK